VHCNGIVQASGKNGLKTVRISQGQYWYAGGAPQLPNYSLYWVGRHYQATGSYFNGGTCGRVLTGGGNQLYGYWGGYKKQFYSNESPSLLGGYGCDTNWDIFSLTFSSYGNFNMKWNGQALYSGRTGDWGMNYLGINTQGCCGGEVSTAEVAEIILYTVAHSSSDVSSTETYLNRKWVVY